MFGFLYFLTSEITCDFAELFEGGFEIVNDFLGENVRIGEIVGFFQAFVSEPEDVEAGFITLMVPLISNYFAL